ATTWANDDRSFMLVSHCTVCHGPNGSSLGPATPTIAGMTPLTFVKAMKEYRDEKRPSTVMKHLAKGYTDEDYKIMGDYFAKQKSVPPLQTVDGDKVKKGAKLHKKYCEECHINESVYTAKSTIIVGQWMPYLRLTLDDFITGHRELPLSVLQVIRAMLKAEGKESIDDLVHFYASQVE
ncbi:hypothetical protein QUF54_01870, partial [Candidatus Marithioploca araucensis]|nr:hypothetical protein [Candidatus Marithioploca araucensis]